MKYKITSQFTFFLDIYFTLHTRVTMSCRSNIKQFTILLQQLFSVQRAFLAFRTITCSTFVTCKCLHNRGGLFIILVLASHTGGFRGARLSSLPPSFVGRDERRAPLKTPVREAGTVLKQGK